MTAIVVKAFNGLKPITAPRLLDQGDAQVADNVRLVSGSLTPLKGLTTLKATTLNPPTTIFRYGTSNTETDYWLEFSTDTDIMRSPIAQDQWNRLYWTAPNARPRYATSDMILGNTLPYPTNSYELGIPNPGAAPTITNFSPAPSGSTPETRTYVFTFVSAYGEEGPPSAASALQSVDPAQPVTITVPGGAPAGSYNITLKRIYRSSTVGSRAQFQFVAEIPVATTSYVDSITQANLGETLQTDTWIAPPVGLKGLRLMANGAAVGFVGKTLYFSEPNLPHAWPHQYPVDEEIVGIATYGQTVAVLTTGYPYLFQGIDPAAMASTKLLIPQSCSSKTSIVETGDGAIFASPDGLTSIGSTTGVITQNLFSRDQWQAYNPSSMKCYVYNGRVVILYTTTGNVNGILVLDISGQGATLTTSNVNTAAAMSCGYYDPRSDTLYLAQGQAIKRFDSGDNLSMTWKSKQFRVGYPMNFSVAQVRAAAYPVTFKLYSGGQLRHTQTVTSNSQFRLPSGYRDINWEFQIEGTNEVSEVVVAQSSDELKAV